MTTTCLCFPTMCTTVAGDGRSTRAAAVTAVFTAAFGAVFTATAVEFQVLFTDFFEAGHECLHPWNPDARQQVICELAPQGGSTGRCLHPADHMAHDVRSTIAICDTSQ